MLEDDPVALRTERIFHLVRGGDQRTAIEETKMEVERAVLLHQSGIAEPLVGILDQELTEDADRAWITLFNQRLSHLSSSIDSAVLAARDLHDRMIASRELSDDFRVAASMALAQVPGESELPYDNRIQWLRAAIDQGLPPTQLGLSYLNLGRLLREVTPSQWRPSNRALLRARDQFALISDRFNEAYAVSELGYNGLLMGKLNEAAAHAGTAVALSRQGGWYRLSDDLKGLGWIRTYHGMMRHALALCEEALDIANRHSDEPQTIRIRRRIAEIYDLQGLRSESRQEYLSLIQLDAGYRRRYSRANLATLLGISYLRQGDLADADHWLTLYRNDVHQHDLPKMLVTTGNLNLELGRNADAIRDFSTAADRSRDRPLYLAQSRLGLLLAGAVRYQTSRWTELGRPIDRAARKHGFFDVLSQLMLARGHQEWGEESSESLAGSRAALESYKQALILAAAFNPYLLDEILAASTSLSLPSIIAICQRRRDAGRQMLGALRDWWLNGHTHITVPPRGEVPGVAKGSRLMDLEAEARSRESVETVRVVPTVTERLEQAL